MNNLNEFLNEFLPFSLMVFGMLGFVIACFATIYTLDKDDKKHPHTNKIHKKA